MVGRARRLWQLAVQHLPMQGALFEAYTSIVNTPREYEGLTDLYQRMTHADFSRDVLHRHRGYEL